MKIGTKLRQLRDSHGFSQDYVADKLSMSQSNYSKIESDKNESVSWEVLPTVADLYNIDIVDLLGDLGVKNINLSKNNDYATNAFYVIQQPNMPESIIKTLQELVESQRLMIETLKLQLEILSKNRG